MKKRYSEEQIIGAIKRQEAGAKVSDLCRELGVSGTALELSQKLLDGPVLEGHFRIHALELFVLRLELLEALHVGRLHAAVLTSPLVEGRRTDAMLPANLADLSSGLCLLQEGNNLALNELRLPHNTFLHHSMMAESSS